MHRGTCIQRQKKLFAENVKPNQTPFLCLTYPIMGKHKRGISLGIKWQTKIKNAVLCFHTHMQQ